jgi:hypothetical protein
MILPNSFQNDSAESFNAQRKSAAAIQFHFGLKEAKFIFNQGNYALEMKKKNPCFYTKNYH